MLREEWFSHNSPWHSKWGLLFHSCCDCGMDLGKVKMIWGGAAMHILYRHHFVPSFYFSFIRPTYLLQNWTYWPVKWKRTRRKRNVLTSSLVSTFLNLLVRNWVASGERYSDRVILSPIFRVRRWKRAGCREQRGDHALTHSAVFGNPTEENRKSAASAATSVFCSRLVPIS